MLVAVLSAGVAARAEPLPTGEQFLASRIGSDALTIKKLLDETVALRAETVALRAETVALRAELARLQQQIAKCKAEDDAKREPPTPP